jgi:hypothetical protein
MESVRNVVHGTFKSGGLAGWIGKDESQSTPLDRGQAGMNSSQRDKYEEQINGKN